MKQLSKTVSSAIKRLPSKSGWLVIATIIAAYSLVNPGMVLAANAQNADASSFAQASQEFGVPEDLLLSISYEQSRWESHAGQASVDGGYGLMNLTTKTIINPEDGRGDPRRPVPERVTNSLSHYTLDDAAQLLPAPHSLLNC